MEKWRSIKDFEGVYEISSYGNVKSLDRQISYSTKKGNFTRIQKERILKPGNDKDGYKQVVLCGGSGKYTKRVHRLVAEAFIPNPENKEHVNHKCPDKSNNRFDNLEWATIKENNQHALDNGLLYGNAKLNTDQIIEIRSLYSKKKITHREISKKYSISLSTVHYILKGKRWPKVEGPLQ